MKEKYALICLFASVSFVSLAHAHTAVTLESVEKTYIDIAHAVYEDSLIEARALDEMIDKFVVEPSEDNLAHVKQAWIAARVPYQQSEAYRFGNTAVDKWEGRVNAWPLDEGLIDYVSGDYGQSGENPYAAANIIASQEINVSGKPLDASVITPALIQNLHELDGIEANVASGYHAIEFLIWGQDLNGTDAGAGNRPASDYDTKNCTGGNCDRRVAYLVALADLLVSDLEEMVASWSEDGESVKKLHENGVLTTAFTGMGSLSYGEQAGERMKLGLMLHDPEEEHDCFSDNTHNSHYYDGLGIQNVWLGHYKRVDGTMVEGPGLRDYVAAKDAAVADALSQDIETSIKALDALVQSAQQGIAYDQLIGAGNESGNALVQVAIDALVAQTKNIERAALVTESSAVEFEGSDSLDDPDAVFQ